MTPNARTLSVFAIVVITAFGAFAQGQWSEPVPVDSINTSELHDFYPSISPDDQSMYLANGNRLKVSRWNGSGWGTPVDLGNNINSGQRQVKATVTPDNRTLYFTSYKAGGYGSYDIWRSEWQDSCECWGIAEVVPPPVNTEYMEWDVQLSHDGRKMFISSDRRFSWGDLDIWCSEWNDSTQDWGEPYNLGMTVNASLDDYSPYPTVDGTKLYFCSWSPHHFEPPRWLGPVDLFVAFNQGNGWDSVDILPAPITTGYWEESPAISDDGAALYFASTRLGGPGWTDIYVSYYTTAVEEGGDDGKSDGIDLKIAPNPGNDQVSLTLTGVDEAYRGVMMIFDVSGRKVSELEVSGGQGIRWDCRGSDGNKVASGIYFIIYSTSQLDLVRKFTLIW